MQVTCSWTLEGCAHRVLGQTQPAPARPDAANTPTSANISAPIVPQVPPSTQKPLELLPSPPACGELFLWFLNWTPGMLCHLLPSSSQVVRHRACSSQPSCPSFQGIRYLAMFSAWGTGRGPSQAWMRSNAQVRV